YELAPEGVPDPPAPGSAHADRSLRDDGVAEGDVLLVGSAAYPIRVEGFVEDTSYLLQGSLWVDPATWREAQSSARPDAAVADGVFQALVVRSSGEIGAAELATRIDEATGGRTSSLTKDEA